MHSILNSDVLGWLIGNADDGYQGVSEVVFKREVPALSGCFRSKAFVPKRRKERVANFKFGDIIYVLNQQPAVADKLTCLFFDQCVHAAKIVLVALELFFIPLLAFAFRAFNFGNPVFESSRVLEKFHPGGEVGVADFPEGESFGLLVGEEVFQSGANIGCANTFPADIAD